MKTKTPCSSLRLIHTGSLLVLLLLSNFLYGQNQQVYLFGNLADIEDTQGFFQKLDALLQKENAAFTLIVTGDLVQQEISASGEAEQLKPLFQLADLLAKFESGQLIIVPGDRDWNSSKKGGEKSLKNIENRFIKYTKQKGYKRVHWAVEKGCPGPEVYESGESLAIIALNTQWWNHPYDKPRPTDALCAGLSEENLKEELADALDDYQDRNVLVVGHHPFYSLGNYGGHFSVGDHFTPIPVLGLFTTAYHASAGNQYDLVNERLHPFVKSMRNQFKLHDNLIYAAGHEKNQQLIAYRNNFLLNSGAPSTARYATKDHQTLFSKKAAGVFRLTYHDNGKVEATFIENTNTGLVEKNKHLLFSSACIENPNAKAIPNTSWVPCKSSNKAARSMQKKYTEKATLPAGSEYKASGFKRFWFGKHYRDSWTMPVSAPYLDLDETHGGLNIYKKGGGRQTTSLKFRSGNGTVYTFRSINKDPTKALTFNLSQTFVAAVFRDQTSTQHPYGAMAVAPLLDKIGILHASPVLYRLPDDPKLGPFKAKYGGLFGMLEENPGKRNKEGQYFGNATKIEKSVDLFKRFYKDQDAALHTEEFVRARLFDILIGDWSKHEDNWKWAVYKTDEGRLYRPIPRDRDHAFSLQDGLVNWLADRPFGMPNIENFGEKYSGLKSLTWQARHMDRFLLQEASKNLFVEQTKYIQNNIKDADIERAIRNMPPEIQELSGKTIEKKLKNRIRHLDKAAEKYYGFLAREVDVTGSKEAEYFDIEYQENGAVHVRTYNNKKGQKGEKLLFDRTFIPSETKELRIWGLGNSDVFAFSGEESSKIKVSVFGGPGDDIFKGKSASKVFLYDKGSATQFQVKGHSKVVDHWNRNMYEYDRQRFSYNHFLPLITLGYSAYTGFGASLGGSWKLRKFEKDDYSSKHKVRVGITTEKNFNVVYNGQFHQAIREWDFVLDAYIAQPQLQNRFYGLGNSSLNQDDEKGTDFYTSAVNTEHFSIGLLREFWQNSTFKIKTGIERNETDSVANTYLVQNAAAILGATDEWVSIPTSAQLEIDFRDGKNLPYKGARALFRYENNAVLSDVASDNFGIATGFIEYFLSTKRTRPITLGLRVGGAAGHGDIPWFKLPTLGTNNGLRGYLQDRFVGKSMVYFSTELRYQLFKIKTSIIPIKIGVKAFYDKGRVFYDGIDETNEWRDGYGFGFFVVPWRENFTLSLTLGFSDEETIYPMFSIGTPLR